MSTPFPFALGYVTNVCFPFFFFSAEFKQEDKQQRSSHHSAAQGEAARFSDTCQKGQEAELLPLQLEQQQGAAETASFQRYLHVQQPRIF